MTPYPHAGAAGATGTAAEYDKKLSQTLGMTSSALILTTGEFFDTARFLARRQR